MAIGQIPCARGALRPEDPEEEESEGTIRGPEGTRTLVPPADPEQLGIELLLAGLYPGFDLLHDIMERRARLQGMSPAQIVGRTWRVYILLAEMKDGPEVAVLAIPGVDEAWNLGDMLLKQHPLTIAGFRVLPCTLPSRTGPLVPSLGLARTPSRIGLPDL